MGLTKYWSILHTPFCSLVAIWGYEAWRHDKRNSCFNTHVTVFLRIPTTSMVIFIDKGHNDFFTFMWPCIVPNFFVIKPTRCTNFTNWFCHETLHVLDSSGWNCSSILVLLESCLQTRMTCTYNCWVCSEQTPDDGQTNCPKHVEFHDKINLWIWCI